MILVNELDQLITVDSSGYVKVWSLRQTQPVTSFYALAPLNLPNSGSDAGRLAGWSSSQGSGAAHRGNDNVSSTSSYDVSTGSSALLRMTKNSIEVAVDSAEYRLQPCRSAAYNYAGRQLFVMGRNNAAHCFFLSGQSSSRAHTQPLRALLVDTSTIFRVGIAHHRLISFSSADCRVWPLLTGTMELGIRANSSEYYRLFNNRLTGKSRGRASSMSKSVEKQPLERKGDHGCRLNSAHPRSSHRTRMYNAHNSVLQGATASSTTMTDERRRLLPPSVDDVMRAVLARPWGSHGRLRRPCTKLRSAGAAVSPHKETTVAAETASFHLLTTLAQPPGGAEASGTSSSATGQGNCTEDDTDGLVTNAVRDHNQLLSDIRCACLGPGGEWVGYALLHGDIRLHRSDSGRLLHTFITTPPSTEDLVEAAMQYQHLFTSVTAAYTLPPLHSAIIGDVATATSHTPPGISLSRGSGGGASASSTTAALSLQSPAVRLTPIVYAKAVALVLERLLTTTIGVNCSSVGAVPASAMPADGDDGLSDNVHREPLYMLYLDATQELLVAYADGLLRSFTLLSHSSTATRVIVSRTLMNRALMLVRSVLASHIRHANLVHPSSAAGASVPAGRLSSLEGGLSAAALKALPISRALSVVGLGDTEGAGGCHIVGGAAGNSRSLSRATCSEGAGGVPTGRLNNVEAVQIMPVEASANIARSMMASLSTRPVEPDVVLLATASSPLGLVCFVHASGLVTVLDVQSRSETDGAVRMRMLSDAHDVKGGSGGGGAEQLLESGRGRAQAGVVVHSFMTTDEITAVTFLGAYPCLVLADRQHQLSFHLMKGSSLLALLGEFGEQLEKDVMAACAAGLSEHADTDGNSGASNRLSLTALPSTNSHGAGLLPSLPHTGGVKRGAGQGLTPTTTSSTLVWTLSVTDTCASQRPLGQITALTFDPLYATVYVGTSQGYIVSYLVRRFLMAFQLTPVFLRGVDGVSVSTYAAELQRTLTAVRPGASPCTNTNSNFLHNYLRVVFDAPAAVATQVTENRLRSPRKRHVNLSANPSTATTKASQSPNELGGLIGLYRCRGDLFHVSWRGVTGKRRGGGSNSRYAPAPSPAISISTSSDVLTAAAVLHDAVTRMMTVTSAHNTKAQACSSTTAKPDETQPWWCTPAGQRVREYVTRRCRGDTDWSDMSDTTGTTTNANPTNLGELELDDEGVQLLRGWVNAVLSERRRDMPQHTSDAGAATEALQQQPQKCFSTTPGGTDDKVSCTSSNETFSSSKFTAVPPMPTTANGHDISASGVSHVAAEQGVDAGVGGGATTACVTTATAQELAEALTQEVQEELLLGKEAPATVVVTHYGTVSPSKLNTPAETPPHPITDSWVECLFTRQAMCTTSRSPLCLLTPPAMLERARRERQDRRGRMAAMAAGAGNAAGSEPAVPEWHTYVEGALPDYLADVFSHPSQVLTEVERQALQQRSITVLQCRRNGYLCVGHADGSVTLWTPYACARLESLCPSTSLAATLDRLAVSVKSQFHCLHARIVLERQRLAFEGSLRSSRHTEEERVAHMKRRIRAMLLEQHLAQLQLGRTTGKNRAEGDPETLAGEDHDTEPQPTLATPATSTLNKDTWSVSNARRHSGRAAAVKIQSSGTGSAPRQPFFCGPMEAELLLMRPLLCLLLGISSPAEFLARQLSLEDLFFLPFKVRNIASLEAFDPHCYDVAVAVAMRRLRRELVEEAEEHATEEPDGAPQLLPDVLTAPVTQAMPTVPPAFPFSRSGNSGFVRCKRPENVYTYRLSSLARAWQDGAHRPQRRQLSEASGAASFPGALRLLLHRAMERPPYLPKGAVATNSLRTVVPAAEPVSSGKKETVHGGSAEAAGAQSPSPTPAVITDCTVPMDGEYYEVCHALQVAEVQAESQWEVEELGRAWKQLHAFAVAPTASSNFARWNREHAGAGVCGSPPAPLPFSSAAAVSTAVHRQVRRGLEARIAALSSRAVAAALLQKVRMCCRPSHTTQVMVPSHLHSDNGESGTCAAWQPPSRRRGGGLAWVQSVLRQQARQAFAEPLLAWLQLLPSPVSPAITTTGCAPALLHGQKRSPATSTTARPALSDEEVLLPPSTHAPLQVLCDASSMPGGDGGDPQATFANSLKECSNAFLTELPSNATIADTAVGVSLSPPEPTRLGTSGHTAVMRDAVREAGQCPLSSQILSATEQLLLDDVGTTLSSRQTFSSSPSPLPQLKCMHASTSSGHQLSSLGVHDTRALKTDRGRPAASPTSDTVSLLSCSISSTSSLSMTGTSPNATLSGPAVHPTLQVRTHRLAAPALHRVQLARTGSCRGAPHQQRAASRGMTRTKGVAGDCTVVEDTLRAAASMATAPPVKVTGYGSGRKGAGGGVRNNRVATVQSFTYYSLLGQAGTTK
ncbi:hypothetical protein, conserved [Leishmania tarentolae]|uniref:Guanine nucleotide-binding protein subunit beta-like protein n=1 Tax=Leishmania tarentolae TaxID=5689 RepID=A0A640K911_LEITA|nr:hypothetical protein, conserved [Leishmania tarentolae]